MQIIEKTYPGVTPLYQLDRICDPASALFIDIETTGLVRETTSLYLIGCGSYTSQGFETRLFFADNRSEESDILQAFADMIQDYTHLLHFNGLKFDIPYLKYKADKYDIRNIFEGITQVDIYKLCKPLRYLLFPDSMRQKAIETFLGIKRDDIYTGGELIDVYLDYEKSPNDEALRDLITHNREDVLGMHYILPILTYLDLKDAPLCYRGYRINSYTDYSGCECEEVIFEYSVNAVFTRSFSAKTRTMYVKFTADDNFLQIRLPIYKGEMKIYFDNYRDYFYLPDEDTAILKTLGMLLPADRHIKATRETCYRKVSGRFLKQPDSLFTPVLRCDLKDKKKYFRFPEDFKEEAAEDFGRSLLNIFFTMKKRC